MLALDANPLPERFAQAPAGERFDLEIQSDATSSLLLFFLIVSFLSVAVYFLT